MLYLGIDLAWGRDNFSALSVLKNNKLIQTVYLQTNQEIIDFINQTKPDQIGIDAPLEVLNKTGNRDIENQFLKDFAKYKLGVYPVNINIMNKNYGGCKACELSSLLQNYKLRENLFEVYPHATIIRCFTKDKVLPYKRKKGRDSTFIKEQLNILQDYIDSVVDGFERYDVDNLKVKDQKIVEDKLDSIICAYTLFASKERGYDSYGDLLIVPKKIL